MTLFSQSARFLKGATRSFSSPYPTANISGMTTTRVEVLQFAVAYESVLGARRPRVPERQTQVVVDLLEAQFVAERVLVEIAAPRVPVVLLVVERLPVMDGTALADAQDRLRSGVVRTVVQPVNRDAGFFQQLPLGAAGNVFVRFNMPADAVEPIGPNALRGSAFEQ